MSTYLLVVLLLASSTPDEVRYRALYKELVETNTTLSSGNCTLAAERMAAHLKAAGFPDTDLHPFAAPGHPREGGLVAVLPGRDPKARAILLLAHLDVVEAKREDWTRDPFELLEENGTFTARGVLDDKAEASIWVDTLVRLRESGRKLGRTLKLALTCGEETGGAFNGAEWLVNHERPLIEAAFALNEGAAGEATADGKRVALDVEAGEKTSQNYRLEVTNPGGHSSRPRKDNAIYQLAAALQHIAAYAFPIELNDVNRGYFKAMARREPQWAKPIEAMLANPQDAAAAEQVTSHDPSWNATLRTTCVATTLEAGHATNALPQRARANINCRIFPGTSIQAVHDRLVSLVADPTVTVTTLEVRGPPAVPSPLTPAVMKPIERIAADMFPGVPVVPILQAGATDGQFLTAAGIPTYGIGPVFVGPDLGNIHGLNEHVSVQALLDERAFLFKLVQALGDAP